MIISHIYTKKEIFRLFCESRDLFLLWGWKSDNGGKWRTFIYIFKWQRTISQKNESAN